MGNPIRRKKTFEVIDDPFTGKERIIASHYENNALGRGGSIDTTGKHKRFLTDCLCNKPVAGQCSLCGALCCELCFKHCSHCGRSLCPRHTFYLNVKGQGRLSFCRTCLDKHNRSVRWHKILRTLLSPFVAFKE